ncbi:MAG TPA: hypothetical protein VL463_34805 [Kofleriaceae bacterium]|jgi:hypothetical protein|nr:hypothetical protein [Kofleriaceae bacterium]
MAKCALLLLVASAVACGGSASTPDAPGGPADSSTAIDATPVDAFVPFIGWIYAHSNTELYRVDPRTLAVIDVGPFQWPTGMEQEFMTDLAVDQNGKLTGVSFGNVYAVDPANAKATYLAPLSREFNGMSYVPASELGETGDDVLIGTALTDGSIWRVDPMTGASTMIGQYGNGWISSGDIVSVKGFGTVATVNLNDPDAPDYLARIDLMNGGAATIIGPTGTYDIWGLGFWGGKVYGFEATNELVQLDVQTGTATTITKGPVNWWGAGVTTLAPIVP